MSYIKPRFTPPSPLSLASFFGCWEWQEILAVLASPRGKPAKYTRQNCWPAVEWRQGGGLVWLNFPTAYSFVMISPNLHAIWVFLFLDLSQDLKLVLLRYFGTLGDSYSLKGSNKKPSRHRPWLASCSPKQEEGARDHPFIYSDGSLQGWFAQVGAVELQATANSSCYLFEFAFFK
jgi:hypothetical protein